MSEPSDDPRIGDAATELPAVTPSDRTVAPTPAPSRPPVETSSLPPNAAASTRYALKELLGAGGMGEVHLCHDTHIGRAVALKIIHRAQQPSAETKARFLREARVQGLLEHPSIVPVYDIGTRTDGSAFFTMKRVHGQTLAKILEALAAGNAWFAKSYALHRLLTAFSNVCLAVDYAHMKGVVHRDLKPGNVMLGDFGEVYVLDWGVAKFADGGVPQQPASSPSLDARVETADGSVFGTLGYAAPEQLDGGEATERSDVYSLGAILFEILALQPLHRGGPRLILESTKQGVDARPSERTPGRQIAPELEAICVKATALAPEDRFPRARDLQEALERYMEGDRDLERRRLLAAGHAERAARSAAVALRDEDPKNEERELAMREAGNALALDPTQQSALRTVTRLLVHPPRAVPPDVRAAMDEAASQMGRLAAKFGLYAFVSWFVALPLFWMAGIRSVPWLAVGCVGFGASAVLCWLQGRKYELYRSYLIIVASMAGFLAVSRFFGPLTLAPMAALAFALTFVQDTYRTRRVYVALAAAFAMLVVPSLLEVVHVLPASYVFHDGSAEVVAQLASFHPLLTPLTVVLLQAAILNASWQLLRHVRRNLSDAETRLSIQAWHLKLMVPEEARHAVREPTVERGRVSLQTLASDEFVAAPPAASNESPAASGSKEAPNGGK